MCLQALSCLPALFDDVDVDVDDVPGRGLTTEYVIREVLLGSPAAKLWCGGLPGEGLGLFFLSLKLSHLNLKPSKL